MPAALRCVFFARSTRITLVLAVSLILSACAVSLVAGNAHSRLLWSFLKPLVGFNPHEINLLESPLIKPRMQALLGSRYEPTVRLLRTANELQQEGALFFLVSRYAPDSVKNITDKAGFVWNADTNQMAVMLIENGMPYVFSETVSNGLEKVILQWPGELQKALDNAEAWQESLKQQATDKAGKMISDQLGLEGLNQPLQDILQGKSAEAVLKEKVEQSAGELIRQPVEAQSPIPASLKKSDTPNGEEKVKTLLQEQKITPKISAEREDDFLKALEKEEAELRGLQNLPSPGKEPADLP